MQTRRAVLTRGLILGALGVGPLGMGAPGCGRKTAKVGALEFDPDGFTELNTTIDTAAGPRTIAYRFHKAIPYVAEPVAVAYQSLNVSVPVSIDGAAVDPSVRPIVFANSVGGYMPSSVANANGVGGGGMTGAPPGGGGPPGPAGAPGRGPPAEVASGGNAMMNHGRMVNIAQQALAAGFVVVEPGARGRTLVNAEGVYYGVAPAAIVDLKAAVRYVRANRGRIPGNTDRIVSTGVSAGGALSFLLGASGDSALYGPLLAELGAADASDGIFAAGSWCPITDLGHADRAYEWNWGLNPLSTGALVDQVVSRQLAAEFGPYQASLGLHGVDDFGAVTADNYGEYLVRTHLQPSARRYLEGLSPADRSAYLLANPFLNWRDGQASFSWNDFLRHVGPRRKTAPAFDAFDLAAPENNLFGRGRRQARHFTDYSLRRATGDPNARIDADLPGVLDLMNPMYFLAAANPGRSRRWWLRVGTKDSDTSLTIVSNLALAAEKLGDDVNTAYYWDAGHGANEDVGDFLNWVGRLS